MHLVVGRLSCIQRGRQPAGCDGLGKSEAFRGLCSFLCAHMCCIAKYVGVGGRCGSKCVFGVCVFGVCVCVCVCVCVFVCVLCVWWHQPLLAVIGLEKIGCLSSPFSFSCAPVICTSVMSPER